MLPTETRLAPWASGGRDASGIDCLGVVLLVCERLGHEVEDPWPRFLREWNQLGKMPDFGSGLPASWRRMVYSDAADMLRDMRTGDVWVWRIAGLHPGCGVVVEGRIWTAEPASGVVCLDPSRAYTPEQVWRP